MATTPLGVAHRAGRVHDVRCRVVDRRSSALGHDDERPGAAVGQHGLEMHTGLERLSEEVLAVEQNRGARPGRRASRRQRWTNGCWRLAMRDTRRPSVRQTAPSAGQRTRHSASTGPDGTLFCRETMKARLIKRFEDEIALLERELTHELPKEIQRARELGDLRENAEYAAARSASASSRRASRCCAQRVSQIQLMNLERIPRDRAGFGSKLTLRERGREFTYELVMPEDANPDRGLVSVASPIGRASSTARKGDEVTAPTPGGSRTFEILKLVTVHDEECVTDTPYSPRLRTGVILCGAGTAGAYQAGVVRALIEAGVKIDVLAAHGAGVITALAAAIDGGARFWDPAGPWTSPPPAPRLPLAPARFASPAIGLAAIGRRAARRRSSCSSARPSSTRRAWPRRS